MAVKNSDVLTLHVLGLIGMSEYPWGELTGRIDTKLVKKEVDNAGTIKSLHIILNSDGGDAYQGLAIGNFIKLLGIPTKCTVIGLCASAANYIALSCDTIEMPANAQWMLHEARSFPWDSLSADDCDTLKRQIVNTNESCVVTYVDRTKQSADKIRQMMKDETWLLGEQCKELGFIDVVTGKVEDKVKQVSRPTIVNQFKNAPSNVIALLAIDPPALKDETMSQEKPNPTEPAGSTSATASPPAPAASPTAAAPASSPALSAGLPTSLSQADVDAAAKKGAETERTRQSEIRQVFQAARVSADPVFNSTLDKLADEYCTAPTMTKQDAKDKLLDVLQHRNQVPSSGTGTSPAPEQKTNNPIDGFKAEYAGSQAIYQKMGLTEDAYVRTRCQDHGIEPPAAK